MKVYKNMNKPNLRHSKQKIVSIIAALLWTKAQFNKIFDNIPPKTAEKVKLHKVKVNYCFL